MCKCPTGTLDIHGGIIWVLLLFQQRLLVVLEESLYIHNIRDMKVSFIVVCNLLQDGAGGGRMGGVRRGAGGGQEGGTPFELMFSGVPLAVQMSGCL